MKYLEYNLQKKVAKYLTLEYKDVFFMSDTIASVKLTGPQQARNKAIQCPSFHCPDLTIFRARKGYHALFLELKKETPFKKDGTLKKSEHLENQRDTMLKLTEEGYLCFFAWDFEQCKRIIDDYLK